MFLEHYNANCHFLIAFMVFLWFKNLLVTLLQACKLSINILIAKSTLMNCTINVDEELNYIKLFKNMLDLAGLQRSQAESKALKWHVYISFCLLCVPHCA